MPYMKTRYSLDVDTSLTDGPSAVLRLSVFHMNRHGILLLWAEPRLEFAITTSSPITTDVASLTDEFLSTSNAVKTHWCNALSLLATA